MSRITVTPSLMSAIFQGFKTLFTKGFEKGQIYYTNLVTVVPSSTSKEVYGWLGQTTGFRQWIGPRVVQKLKTHDFSITNVHFENTVGVDKDQIEDDEFGVLSPVFEQLGRDAAEHPDEVVFNLLKNATTEICYDGKPFLATNHPVYKDKDKNKATATPNLFVDGGNGPMWYLFDTSKVVRPIIWQLRKPYNFVRLDQATDDCVFKDNQALYGSDSRANAGFGLWQLCFASNMPLTAANFKAVRDAMEGQKGDNGRPLKVTAMEIWYPTVLRSAAEALFTKALILGGETNELYQAVKQVRCPYLD